MKTYVQQIMLGSVTGTEKDARETLQRIIVSGYDGLELNRFMIHPSSFMVRMHTKAAGMPTGRGGKLNWPSLLQESGLSTVTLHADLGSLEREPEAVLQDAQALGTDRIVITGMYRFDYGSENEVKNLAERLNRAGEKLSAQGFSLLYHNHNAELLRVDGSRTAYELLIEETEPRYVNFEFDSYWFTDAGADAAQWMKRLGSRMKLWHVTDRGFRVSGPSMTPILRGDTVECGDGTMDLHGLRKLALANGVTEVVLETHKNWIGKDPLKSLERSAKWLHGEENA